MREHRNIAGTFSEVAKTFGFCSVNVPATPLRRVFQEDLDRLATDGGPALDGEVEPARDGHVRAEARQSLISGHVGLTHTTMKTLFKIIKWTAIIVLSLVALLFLARNFIARKAVEVTAKQMTGFPLEIGKVNIGVFQGLFEVHDFKLMNPPEFQGGTFVDLPLLRVDYNTKSMLSKVPHINELAVDLKELVIVTNAKGERNATVLQKSASGSSDDDKKKDEKPAPKEKEKKKQRYQVDKVRVHIGTVVMRDCSKTPPSERRIAMNTDLKYNNINENTSITMLVLDTVFKQMLGDAIKGVGDSVQKGVKGFFDSFKKKQEPVPVKTP
jgi:hypothetical protein